ncbi:hypothetical protein [Beijerinckia sp. L45]|uniref:hypothetical protein n=1 Tax=Beijerinckia sp. L45 TaxID=1641855 RepID=UPI00131E472E|nr:hypothetical protein [Beijerinckia sp. L45]
MLGSPNDNEALATARALRRILDGAGSSFVELADEIGAMGGTNVSKYPSISTTWTDRQRTDNLHTDYDKARWCADFGGMRLSTKERAFVHDLARRLGRYGGYATDRQAEWLDAILLRLRRAAA